MTFSYLKGSGTCSTILKRIPSLWKVFIHSFYTSLAILYIGDENAKNFHRKKLSQILSSLGLTHVCNTHVCGYEVDILLTDYPVVIEADGELYHNGDRLRYDNMRDSFLHKQGYKVIRIWGRDLIRNRKKVRQKLIVKLSSIVPSFKGLIDKERRILSDLRMRRPASFEQIEKCITPLVYRHGGN